MSKYFSTIFQKINHSTLSNRSWKTTENSQLPVFVPPARKEFFFFFYIFKCWKMKRRILFGDQYMKVI